MITNRIHFYYVFSIMIKFPENYKKSYGVLRVGYFPDHFRDTFVRNDPEQRPEKQFRKKVSRVKIPFTLLANR